MTPGRSRSPGTRQSWGATVRCCSGSRRGWDERYTSQEADRWLAGRRRAKGERDAVAAELILQGWLDRQAADRRRAADADEDADEPAGEEGET